MELLAPAGSIAALKYAINYGADAVYLGLGVFNARAKAEEFDIDNLSEWVDYCHIYGVKVYVTVNTIVWQDELPAVYALLDGVLRAGADAVIACDMAVITYALSIGLPVHISTQAGVHNAAGARFFEKLGARRVVLSREFAFADLEDIAKTSMETEVFVHGALCVSFSGGCLLSSSIGGYSGNRGLCRQPCRQYYKARTMDGTPLKDGYLLSTADLMMDNELDKLRIVDSLKIEGRLKRPAYVGEVVKYYRALLNGQQSDKTPIYKVYNRGSFSSGYDGKSPIIYPIHPAHIGVRIGEVLSTELRKGFLFARVKSTHPLIKGDGLKVLRDGEEVGGSDVTSVQDLGKGIYLIPMTKGVKPGDEVRLTTDCAAIASLTHQKKLHCNMEAQLVLGAPATLTVTAKGKSITVVGDVVLPGKVLSAEEVRTQLGKLGGTAFVLGNCRVYAEGYLPKSSLNALRNKAIEQLSRALAEKPLRAPDAFADYPAESPKLKHVVEVESVGQLGILANTSIDGVVLNPVMLSAGTLAELLDKARVYRETMSMCDTSTSDALTVFVKLPRIQRNGQYRDIEDWAAANGCGLLADNVGTVQVARERGIPYIAGIGLNVSNLEVVRMYADASMILASVEVGVSPALHARTATWQGLHPLMTLTHCPQQVCRGGSCAQCVHKGESLVYESMGASYLVRPTVHKQCIFTMYIRKPRRIDEPSMGVYVSYVGGISDSDIRKAESISKRAN